MDNWKIKVNIDDESFTVRASLNGKQIDTTDKTSAQNIAGILAQVACKMVSHFNNINNKDKNKQ